MKQQFALLDGIHPSPIVPQTQSDSEITPYTHANAVPSFTALFLRMAPMVKSTVFSILSSFLLTVPTILGASAAQLPPNASSPVQPNETQAQQGPPVRFKVDVNLTVIYATVTNPAGWVDRSLTKDAFELKENGQKQEIAFFSRESEMPLRMALLVDSSLSTARDLKFEAEAASRFFASVLRPQDAAAVFEFSYDVNQLTGYTNELGALTRSIREIHPDTATSLYDAIYLASNTLKGKTKKKVIIIVSDGADTTSRLSFQDALRAANEAQAIIYAIVITPVKSDAGRALGGEHALMTLSEETGGKAFFPNDLNELDDIYSRISEELRTQYTLGFYSSVSTPLNELRRITLTTRNRSLDVRTRRGYFSGNR
jgi:Ca-activated chloride channel family protein